MSSTPSVRRRLWIFLAVGTLAVLVAGVRYAQIPQSLGVGRYTVVVDLADGAGLYPHANVTYRGTTVGRVQRLESTTTGARATLSLDSSVPVPADLDAAVRSMSAIGEQYIELSPRTDSAPHLAEGSVIPRHRTTVPAEIGETLDQLHRMLTAVGPGELATVLEESFTALNGAAPHLRRLITALREISAAAEESKEPTRELVERLRPLLETQVVSRDAIAEWTRSLAAVSGQLEQSDPNLRAVLDDAAPAADEATAMFTQLRPTLPILLANLVTVEQVAAVYNPALEQIFVLYPNVIAASQGGGLPHVDDPMQNTFFANQYNDPPPCLEGFLPPEQRRSPTETDVPPTPKDLYCKVAPDDPRSVRGARNLPCLEFPGHRAATVQLCRLAAGQTAPESDVPPASARGYDPIAGTYRGADGNRYSHRGLTDGPTGTSLESLLVPPP